MESQSRVKLASPEERMDLILLGLAREQTVEALCQQAGVSRELFYRWMKRVRTAGLQALLAKEPGPKAVPANPEPLVRKLRERLMKLEKETVRLRKERDRLKLLFQVAQRIIRRRAWGPLPEVESKKKPC